MLSHNNEKTCYQKFSLKKSIFIFFLLFSILSLQKTYAEHISFDEFNFTMDLPESFELKEGNLAGDSFFFETKLMPVKFALKFYSSQKYNDAQETLEDAILQLGTKGSIEKINWFNRECFLSSFSFVMPNQTLYSGWAFCIQIPLKDNPSEKVNILLLTYADNKISRDCDQYMLSILDSVFFCKEDFRRPGPITTFAFPDSNETSIKLNIGNKSFFSSIDEEAIQRSQFVIDREYAVLKIYANQKTWKEAWQRYYRQIFRESYNAFDKIATDIYKNIFPIAQKNNQQNPNIEYIQMILDWIQDFTYTRDKANSDFTAITASIQGSGCDCDSRSLLMCILMEHIGIKSELFISREYSHAVFGLNVNKNGAAIEINKMNFVLGETTAKVDFGLIAKEHNDTKKWIEVDLP